MKKITIKNKRKFYTSLVIASTLTVAAVATGLGVYNIYSNPSTIVLHTPSEEVVLDTNEVGAIEDLASFVLSSSPSNNSISSYADSDGDGIDDETGEPIEGGEGEGSETPPESTVDSITQLTAKWIQIAFFNASLTGSFDVLSTTPSEGSILNPADDDNWVSPEITDVTKLKNYSNFINFYWNTSTQNKKAYIYISEKAKIDYEIAVAGGVFEDVKYENIWDMYNDTTLTNGEFINFMNVLYDEDADYQLEILNFLYAYAYLWQETEGGAYDYFLTQKMITYKPAFIWKLDVENIGQGISQTHYNDLLTWTTDVSEGIVNGASDLDGDGTDDWSWGEAINDDNITGGSEIISNQTLTGDTTWDIGFQGIQGKTTATITTNGDLWKTNNAYQFTDNNDGQGIDLTQLGKFGPQTLANPQVYSEYGNAVVKASSTAAVGQLIAPVLIYPFIFATEYDANTQTAKYWNYSLYAVEVDANGNPAVGGGYYINADKDTPGAVSLFDITTPPTGSVLDSEYIQLYIVYSLYKSDVEMINNAAYKYWNDRGFYIELTGEYKDKYGSIINSGLQKQEE